MFPSCRLGPALVTEMRRRCPQVVLALEHLSTEKLVHAVERGEYELGIVRSVPEQNPLCKRLLAREPMGVCLSARHQLAARGSIKAAALADEPMIWLRRALNPELYDHVLRALDRAGLRVCSVESVGRLTSLALVAEGLGWALTCQSEVAEGTMQDLAWRPFADVHLVAETWAIWAAMASSPHIAQTVDALTDICSPARTVE